MGRSLFPIVDNIVGNVDSNLPFEKGVAINDDGSLLMRDGRPVKLEGSEALRSWIFRALRAERGTLEMQTIRYGNDMYTLLGRGLSSESNKSEVERCIKECLLASPYIKNVAISDISITGDVVSATVVATTIYGQEVTSYV